MLREFVASGSPKFNLIRPRRPWRRIWLHGFSAANVRKKFASSDGRIPAGFSFAVAAAARDKRAMTLSPLGDTAVVVALSAGTDGPALPRVQALAVALERDPPAGVVDVVPAFASVTVHYNPLRTGGFAALCAQIEARAARAESAAMVDVCRIVEIPVCYGGEWGPDLAEVATRAGVEVEAVVALHTEGEYSVQAVGFAPGFAYLSGLPETIHTPRRATPRTSVPAGTVGIGGEQTGVYPLATPGGWNLIGRTPLRMFDAARETPALLRVGDRVRFRAISQEKFARWK
jgi:inhibitor of KinA